MHKTIHSFLRKNWRFVWCRKKPIRFPWVHTVLLYLSCWNIRLRTADRIFILNQFIPLNSILDPRQNQPKTTKHWATSHLHSFYPSFFCPQLLLCPSYFTFFSLLTFPKRQGSMKEIFLYLNLTLWNLLWISLKCTHLQTLKKYKTITHSS